MNTPPAAAESDKNSIEVMHVSKSFSSPPAWAVRNITFTAKRGEIVGLIGENGAGKTTLLRIMSTILNSTEGSVTINGCSAAENPGAVRSSIGILFAQQHGLYERLSAKENIMYFAQLNGMTKSGALRRLNELSQMLDMHDFLEKPAGTFSTGMRQKTLIARAVIHNPDILMLDEPTTGLDIASSKTVNAFISWCRETQKTVIFSSHDLYSVQKTADRVLILHRGDLLADSPVRELTEGISLEEYYFSLQDRYT